MTPRKIAWTLLALAVVAVPTPAAADPASLGAKQGQAAALQARIQAQGKRLSLADEDYNEARYRRRSLDGRLARVAAEVAAAEQRWTQLRRRLGARVRTLYMHPGASMDAWLGLTSFTQASRARVLSASVLTADSELVDATQLAHGQVRERARLLGTLRAQAQRAEQEMAAKRALVARELAAQRALLSQVKGEIARIIEAERQRELEEAARAAAAEAAARAAAATPSPTASAPVTGGVLPTPTPVPLPPPTQSTSAKAAKAVQTARAQIGKPYEWSGSGPNSFDCSGLTMYAWASAGVQLPHSSRAQYSSLPKVSRSQIRPGDLLFFGSPIHHVGIYEGNGIMINAPETGENVRRDAITRPDFAGAARPG